MAQVDLLIDGDLLLYKSACGVETEIKWDEENHLLYANVEDAWGCTVEKLNKLFDKFSPRTHLIALTGKGNFRKDLYPEYKANRQGTRKPLCYGALIERLNTNYNVVCYDGIEADDVLGILATRPSQNRRIIVSEDKDMKTLPCTLYIGGEVISVTEAEADYNHMYQTLIGDQADNYPGCKGIGAVKAKKLLEGSADMWKAVVSAFKGNEEEALVQARLARILRDSDWDTDKKEPILWTPTPV